MTHDRLRPAADPCDTIRRFSYNEAHAVEQGDEGSVLGPTRLAVQQTMLNVMRCVRVRCLGLLAAISALAMSAGTAPAQSPEHPRLQTNEAYVEDATRATTLAIADPMAVFAFVLDSLPDRVKVYPTENYYYFRFIHGGAPYAGNIRLDPLERDQGKVQFSYYPDLTEWRDKMRGRHVCRPRCVARRDRGAARAPGLSRLLSQQERRLRAQRSIAGQAAGGRARTRREVPWADLR